MKINTEITLLTGAATSSFCLGEISSNGQTPFSSINVSGMCNNSEGHAVVVKEVGMLYTTEFFHYAVVVGMLKCCTLQIFFHYTDSDFEKISYLSIYVIYRYC